MRTFSGIVVTISVSMNPGATALTMPFAATSLASDLVKAATPAFDAA